MCRGGHRLGVLSGPLRTPRQLPLLALSCAVGAVLAACRPAPVADPGETTPAVDTQPTDTATPTDTGPAPPARLDLAPSAAVSTEHVATALACASCHGNVDDDPAMRDAAGRPVSPYDLWRASMMANAARDPFWWAAVSFEQEPWPRVDDDIESGCMVCHAPGLAIESRLTGAPLPTLETLRGTDAQAVVGLDGVTCTVCHQAEASGLGDEDSFNGEFVTAGAFLAYGPYADPVTGPMETTGGYAAAYGAHIGDPGLCASCHMVQNTVLGIGGEPTNRHVDEQEVYREWQASAFDLADGATPTTCQDCHVPTFDADGVLITTPIARDPAGESTFAARSPYGQHTFLGGNAYVLSLLRDNAAELAPDVSYEAFDAQVSATRQFLTTAARLTVGPSTRDGDTLAVPIQVENLTGHKLPTGFPSRRMWLDVTVTDAAGTTVFRTGATDTEGRLIANDGDRLAGERARGPVHSHRDTLADGQVQVWESVLRDSSGDPSYLLLVSLGFLKDDRILPAGWDGGDGSMDPEGIDDDPSFVAGSDTVTLQVVAPEAGGPYALHAALRYQSIGARYLDEVLEGTEEPVRVLERMVEASDRTPDTIAEVWGGL